jgi:hypothetical protein
MHSVTILKRSRKCRITVNKGNSNNRDRLQIPYAIISAPLNERRSSSIVGDCNYRPILRETGMCRMILVTFSVPNATKIYSDLVHLFHVY